MQTYNTGRKEECTKNCDDHTSFHTILLNTIKQCTCDNSIKIKQIDPWIRMLAISPSFQYSIGEARQIAREIKHTMLEKKHPNNKYELVSFEDLESKMSPFLQECKEWQSFSDNKERPKLYFFCDITAIKSSVNEAAEKAGYSIETHSKTTHCTINNKRFEDHVSPYDIACEAIWSAKGTSYCIQKYANKLTDSFKKFENILSCLIKTFSHAKFELKDRQLFVQSNEYCGTIDYNRISHACELDQKDIQTWLSRTLLSDLEVMPDTPSIRVRSPIYLRARPDVLHCNRNEYILTVERETSGHIRDDQSGSIKMRDRFRHYYDEAERSLHQRKFTARAVRNSWGKAYGISLIGDQIASIASHPRLILGALKAFADRPSSKISPWPSSVRIFATCEDVITIADSNMSWEDLNQLIRNSTSLFCTLNTDGSDPLHLDHHIELPRHHSGIFSIQEVPKSYFELMEVVNASTVSLPPGRREYLKGLALELIDEPMLALKVLQKGYGLNRKDGDISHALGRTLAKTGKTTEAIQFLERAAHYMPRDPEVASALGLALLDCGRVIEAIKAFEHAVKIEPAGVYYLASLGLSYFANDQWQKAEAVLTKALAHSPDMSEAHTTMARIRLHCGDFLGAKTHARRAFAADPSNKGAQELMWVLNDNDGK